MKILNRFKSKKTIKKPNYPVIITLWFVVLMALTFIICWLYPYPLVEFWDEYREEYRDREIEVADKTFHYLADGVDEEEAYAELIKVVDRSLLSNSALSIEVNGETIADTWASFEVVWFDKWEGGTYRRWTSKWIEGCEEEFSEVSGYMTSALNFIRVLDAYVDPDSNIVYPGNVQVVHATFSFITGEISDRDRVIAEVDLTPKDPALYEGFEHVVFTNDGVFDCIIYVSPTKENAKAVAVNEYSMGIDDAGGYLPGDYTFSFDETYIESSYKIRMWFTFIVAVIVILILSFVLGTIDYFSKKSVYDIFEYRRKTTEAMAHDLKTPLAVAAVYVDNLKESLNTDRAGYHADKIEESIKHLDSLVSDILSFSKSQYSERKLNAESVDLNKEIESHLSEIKAQIEARNLKVETNGEATLKTDRDLINQAVFNLLDNAVKYAKQGSTIKCDIEGKKLTITNDVDEDIDVKNLKEPFVKGNSERGEKNGSGLGLSVADSNLNILGYSLSIKSENKKFTAVIKFQSKSGFGGVY